MIDWMKLKDEDILPINRIAKKAMRTIPILIEHGMADLEMDLQAAHLFAPLDLETLEAFKNGDFIHDITGIVAHIDRETGQLDDGFSPRSAAAAPKQSEKTNLETVKGNAPECPNCGNWNAMLDYYEGAPDYGRIFKCRDCGHTLRKEDCIVTVKTLDKPGMGNASTYTAAYCVKGECF